MGSDVSITVGKHLEQLIRHYPETFQSTILGSLAQTRNTVLASVLSYCNENDQKLCVAEQFGGMINFACPARFFLVSAASNQAIREELSSTKGAHSSSSPTLQ
jgi:hypothetical protein